MTVAVLPAKASDDELARLIADGDQASLGLLFDRHHADVRRLVRRLGIGPADAEDLVQQTFLEVAAAADRFDGRAPMRTWILGIAAMMVRRHRRSFARWLRGLGAIHASDSARPLPPTPAEVFDERQRAARAERALLKLSRKKRDVFVLVVLEGLRGEDVASALAIPVATVWTRLHHARRELRAHLTEEEV